VVEKPPGSEPSYKTEAYDALTVHLKKRLEEERQEKTKPVIPTALGLYLPNPLRDLCLACLPWSPAYETARLTRPRFALKLPVETKASLEEELDTIRQTIKVMAKGGHWNIFLSTNYNPEVVSQLEACGYVVTNQYGYANVSWAHLK